MVRGESKDGECFRAHTNYVKFKFQHPVNKILGTQLCSLGSISSVAVSCCEASRVVMVETMGPQNLTYLLADPLQKKFHPCPRSMLAPTLKLYLGCHLTVSHFCFSVYWLCFHLVGARGQKATARSLLSSSFSFPLSSENRLGSCWPAWCASHLGQGKLYSDQTGVTRPSRAGDGSVPPQPGRLRRSAGCWTNPSNLNLLRMDFGPSEISLIGERQVGRKSKERLVWS